MKPKKALTSTLQVVGLALVLQFGFFPIGLGEAVANGGRSGNRAQQGQRGQANRGSNNSRGQRESSRARRERERRERERKAARAPRAATRTPRAPRAASAPRRANNPRPRHVAAPRPSGRRVTVVNSRPRAHRRVVVHSPRTVVVGPAVAVRSHAQVEHPEEETAHFVPERYMSAGIGLGGFWSHQYSAQTLPGEELNLALGIRGLLFAGEFGFAHAGYRVPADSVGTKSSSLALWGIYADLKLQPSFGILEPYVSMGLGAQTLQGSALTRSTMGGSLRTGAGVDLRIGQVAFGLKYGYQWHDFSYGDAVSSTFGANLSLYF